ncbi:hypothetical protein [Enterococcus cecorum]|uniref:hypothetical protein n=1 Tax=Enterococcus cecorum TaxID=44008 RepID=UPI00148DF9CD|nr:hypothetical protein [Enterococcus cecorum]
MTVEVWKRAKVTYFKSGSCRLSTCGQSAIMSTYDNNNEIMAFMHVPKEILDAYAENYLAENFELTENDGWVRILKGDEEADD